MGRERLDVAYVLKWAAVGPILEVHNADADEDGWLRYQYRGHNLISPKYWARTLADAQAKTASLRRRRLAALERQCEKLEKALAEPATVELRVERTEGEE